MLGKKQKPGFRLALRGYRNDKLFTCQESTPMPRRDKFLAISLLIPLLLQGEAR